MNKYLIGFVMIFSAYVVQAQTWTQQSSLEFGIFAGGSNYKGELVNKLFESRGTHFNGGILTRWNPNERVGFKLGANYGKLSGYDNWYSDDAVRKARNLSFETKFWDFSGTLEINLRTLGFKKESGAIPYVFVGVAVFKYNPQSQFIYDPNSAVAQNIQNYASLQSRDGEWVNLQSLSTEGQGTTEYNDRQRYSLTQLAIPFGGGIKFKMNNNFTLGLEYGLRKTFTDYIDDVSTTYVPLSFLESQYGPMSAAMSDRSPTINTAEVNTPERGDDGNKDWYAIFGVTLTYRIFSTKVRCPTFY
jgi:opacity protein-like surface antigen